MTLPKFLIIGAMKAGTTTLYADLLRVPGVYLPPEKEPEDLISPAVETEGGKAIYEWKFSAAPPGAICGEASTAYSKRPTYEGVPARAARVLGSNVKIIYLTREPIERILSQYRHLMGLGLETRPLNEAVLEDETYVAYSRYDWQILPWRETFGERNILMMALEDYLSDRRAALSHICRHLDVECPEQIFDTHRNASEGKRVAPPGTLWSRVARSQLYLYRIKPILPASVRDRVKDIALRRARGVTEELLPGVRRELERRLQAADKSEQCSG